MEEYHIGKEIEKEVRKQYPSIDAFAKALHRERQTVYDIFKRTYIATDRLIDISRLLNRNFLRELSEAYLNGYVAGDNATTFQDTISQLLPEDEFQVIEPSRIAEIADEYFTGERQKPILMFFNNGTNPAPETFRNVGKKILGAESIIQIDMNRPASVDKLQDLKNLPYVKAVEIWTTGDIDKAINTALNIIKETGKFVFIFRNFGGNGISKAYDGGGKPVIRYGDLAEVSFKRWHNYAHIFAADNDRGDFVRNQKLYGSYRLYRDFPNFFLYDFPYETEADFEPLRKRLLEKHTFSVRYEDAEDNISRCYITETVMMPWDRELFSECSVTPYSEVRFDVSKESGKIVACGIVKE